ncbi:MAG: DUF4442 domain-containing protein [Gammaproteobacteria bacterium]|nr:MAG: DUF4442 domain-containing protein [Gammaproteobacteria bacterium]
MKSWRRLSGTAAGRWLFARLVGWQAPYFATISPRVDRLQPGRCETRLRKRRRVLNHIGSVHAIAMCNLAELAAGLMTDASIPPTHRWIPKGMTVEYRAKAMTDLRAVAAVEPLPVFGEASDFTVPVEVTDADGQLVFSARITMWVSPRRAA